MKLTHLFRRSLVLFAVLIVSAALKAQDSNDLYIFGFSQTMFNNKVIKSEIYPYPADNPTNGIPFFYENEFRTNTFALHQLNLFFRKPISEKTTFFLNLEATGSYSTRDKSGHLEIPEGWISHQFTPNIQLKVGLLIPRFNNLNEIRNRLPLFPYIIRPSIYEDLFNGLFNQEDFIPKSAYIQFTGELSVRSKLLFDYSVFIGNSENSYSSDTELGEIGIDELKNSSIYKGENLTELLSIGGRVGVKNVRETLKFGISGTFDHDNRNEISEGSITRFPGIQLPALGDVKRYRLGLDLSFSLNKLDFESEYIGVFHDHSKIRKTPQYRDFNLNKQFYYGLLTYNFTDQYYAFGGYNQFSDQSFEVLVPESPDAAGVHYFAVGGGIRFADGVVFKGQYSYVLIGDNPHVDIITRLLTAGVSVVF